MLADTITALERENANYAATRVSLREPAQKDTPGFTVHSGRYDSGVAAPEQHKHLEEQQQQQQQQQEGAKQSAATPLLPSVCRGWLRAGIVTGVCGACALLASVVEA